MSIKKKGNKWIVTDRSGNRILGTHSSRKAALRQLGAIEAKRTPPTQPDRPGRSKQGTALQRFVRSRTTKKR